MFTASFLTDNASFQDAKIFHNVCASPSFVREENVGDDEVNIRLFWIHSAVIWLEALGLCCKSLLEESDSIFSGAVTF